MGRTTRSSATLARGGRVARRIVLRAAFAVGVIAGTAGVLAPILTRRPRAGVPANSGPEGRSERSAEMYRGRHIQWTDKRAFAGENAVATRSSGRAGGSGPPGEAMTAVADPAVEVLIDGRPLHVMRRADGSYLSLVNHYESFPTLLDLARAAVDELGSAQLSKSPPHRI
ncbi:tyrosinase family oxidase copper chaperone [Streptomyces sp. H27-C3]|uniref:tyrosinase family oxidase copper chaperone n=1 Tax=Streptomyces sp. H27-C3 TaxID=3046305 RepID=UPI0024B92F9E|nr:tyrosinase family oxidase copper chaperone [Streptomyces sp. H27-C3]MDJ0460245.1 tyrosinase family oxidase copper chaperone [Streptomyces sp. H27-C3]